MNIRPIRNEDDLSWALSEVAGYFDREPAPGSPDADRFDVLSTLIEAYEASHHPVPDAEPTAVLRYAMEELGRSQAELASLLGSRSRASEILSGRRRLTLEMIAAISEAWRIPIGALVPRPASSAKAA